MRIGHDYTKQMDVVVRHLQLESSAVFVFANSRRLTNTLVSALELKLDSTDGVSADIVHMHGHLDKTEKFSLINIFCRKLIIQDYSPNIMISTAAADLGVDHPNAQCIVNIEFPDCLASLFQRQGRGSRNHQISSFIIIGGVKSYIMLYRRINTNIDIRGDDSDFNEAALAVSEKAFNNVIASPTKRKSKFGLMLEKEYFLSPTKKKNLRLRQTNDSSLY